MITYYFCFSFSLVSLFIGITQNRLKNLFTFLIFSIFTLVSGLRYEVGADYGGYLSYFKSEGISKSGSEIGYSIFINISKILFGQSFSLFIFFQSILFFVLLFILFKLFSEELNKNLVLPFFFIYSCQYFLGGIFGQSKQAIAILLINYGLFFSYKKKILPLIISLLLAASFHISVLISVPILMIIYFRSKVPLEYSLPSFLIISILIFQFISIPNIIELISKLPFVELIRMNFFEQVNRYVESERYGVSRVFNSINLTENLIMTGISVYSIFFGNRFLRILSIFYLFSPIFTFSFSNIAIFSQRFSRIFKFSEVFLLPIFFDYFSGKKVTKFLFFLTLIILILKPFLIIALRPNSYLPYKSIFY